MKPIRLSLTLGLCLLAFSASAQWVWMDKDGRKVFSDRPPGVEIPEKSIIKQPGKRVVAPVANSAPGNADEAASAAALAAASAASKAAAKPAGKDKELEDKKKQAEAAEAAKTKAETEKVAAAKAENCERAKRNLATLKSGVRLQRADAKGEREFISDKERASETTRLEGVASGC